MQRAQKGSGDAAAGPFPCIGEDRGDAGASSEKNDALLQSLTIRCEVWDKALLREDAASARQIALVEAINKFNRSVDIETVSYADYIGSTLYCELSDTIPGLSPLPAASLANERGNYARSLPVAIHHGAAAESRHDDFRCSPNSLSTARSMWVPQVMPPACEMERYAWAVHVLNFTMAVTERDRDREERERAKAQGISPATAHIMERLRRGHMVNALTRSPLAEEERKLSDYSRSSSTNTATKDGESLETTSPANSGVSQRKSSSSSPMGSESDCSDSQLSSQFLSPMGPQNVLDP